MPSARQKQVATHSRACPLVATPAHLGPEVSDDRNLPYTTVGGYGDHATDAKPAG